MISIRQFLEQRQGKTPPNGELLEASLQMNRLLLDSIAQHAVRGRDSDFAGFSGSFAALIRDMDEPPTAMRLLELSSAAVESMDLYAQQTTDYLRGQNEQMQAMLVMLTETLADVSGQADENVVRLQAIEQQIESATELDDMRLLNSRLESCLVGLREAVAHQRKGSAATMERLRHQIGAARKEMTAERPEREETAIDLAPESLEELPREATASYVAVFRLQRAAHIAARFGEKSKQQMLSLLSQSLNGILAPGDRLLRWKGTSFVLFLNASSTLHEIRVMLSEAVARTGQHYVEVGKRTALISVGVDWTVFRQDQCPSLDAVFTEIESFLASEYRAGYQPAEKK